MNRSMVLIAALLGTALLNTACTQASSIFASDLTDRDSANSGAVERAASSSPTLFIISSPANGASASGSVSVTGHSGSSWLNVAAFATISGEIDWSKKLSADVTPSNGSFSLTVDLSSQTTGSDQIAIVAFSTPAGETGGMYTSLLLTLAVAAPQADLFTITSPASGSSATGTVTVQGKVGSEWMNISVFAIANGQIDWSRKIGPDTSPANGSYSLTVNLASEPNGSDSLAVVAFSTAAGKTGGTYLAQLLDLEVSGSSASAAAPVAAAALSIISPPAGASVSSSVIVNGQVGSEWVNLAAYAVSNGLINWSQKISSDASPSYGDFSLSVDLSSQPLGSDSIAIVAFSKPSGQTGGSFTWQPISLVVANNGASTGGSSIGSTTNPTSVVYVAGGGVTPASVSAGSLENISVLFTSSAAIANANIQISVYNSARGVAFSQNFVGSFAAGQTLAESAVDNLTLIAGSYSVSVGIWSSDWNTEYLWGDNIASFVVTPVVGGTTGLTYYVSPSGSDSNPGTSQAAPWKTVAKMAAMAYGADDSVLFEGGQTFTGCISFNSATLTSTVAHPFTLGAYGSGRFTLLSNCPGQASGSQGARNPVINLTSVSGFILQDAILSGNGTGTQYGVLISNPGTSITGGITIQRCDFSDFNTTVAGDSAADIDIQGYPGPTPVGMSGINILDNTFHGANGVTSLDDTAINGFGYGPNISNVVMQGNTMYNFGGHGTTFASGMSFNGWSNSVVQNNYVHDVGANSLSLCGGPSGILGADASGVTVQNNEVYNVRPVGTPVNGSCDWVGIDLDISVANSIVQYNYVHDNYGAGLLAYAGQTDATNNIYRYNLLINNASEANDASFRISGYSNNLTNLQVYNNTIYNDNAGAASMVIADYGLKTISGQFANNIFYNANGSIFLKMPYNTAVYSGLSFNNNAYYSPSGTFSFVWNGATYSSLPSLMSGTGMEASGLFVNPDFDNATPTGSTGGFNPAALTGFELQSASPLRGRGISISLDVAKDLFGVAIPNGLGSGRNIGASNN